MFGKMPTTANKETRQESKPASQNTQADSNIQEVSNLSVQYMTPKDLEKELGLTLGQQYKLRSTSFRKKNAKRGRQNLPFIKQMGLIVYDRNDVIAWLNANKNL